MRKALMGLILAATVMTPIAAEAQDWHNRDRGGRGARSQNENSTDEGRAARAERRQERQQERQAAQQTPQVQQQQQVQVVERQRGDGGSRYRGGDGNRGDGGSRYRGGDGNRGDGGSRYRGGDGSRYRGTGQTSIYPQAWQGDPNSPQLRRYQELERRNQQSYGNQRYDGRRDGRTWRGDRDWRGDRNSRRTDWNRSWRDDRRYDWQRWRYTNRNIFNLGRYYSPYGNYGYNRFSIGFFLEPLFFGRNYWIGDPWQYRLPPAPPGTQWVRYYDDVLLVDIYTGEVLDAIYDFFW